MRVRQDRAFARVAVSLLVRNHHLARIAHVHSHQRDLETGDVGTQHRAVNTVGRRRQQVGGVDADTSARKQLILHVNSRRNQRRQVALRRRTVGKVMNQHIGVAVKLRYHLLIVRCAVGICARLLLCQPRIVFIAPVLIVLPHVAHRIELARREHQKEQRQ